jgi:hypothetical protein
MAAHGSLTVEQGVAAELSDSYDTTIDLGVVVTASFLGVVGLLILPLPSNGRLHVGPAPLRPFLTWGRGPTAEAAERACELFRRVGSRRSSLELPRRTISSMKDPRKRRRRAQPTKGQRNANKD